MLRSTLHVLVVTNRNFFIYVPFPIALLPDFVAEPSENDQLSSYISFLYVALIHVDETPGTYEKVPERVYCHSRLPSDSLYVAYLLPDVVLEVARAELCSLVT